MPNSQMRPRKRRPPSKKAARMGLGITRAEARAYVARWELVNAHIAAERRAKTPTERFRELVQLMQWAKVFGWRDSLESEEEKARDIWNRLRRMHCAQT
jgi:hypothetical protein